MSAFKVNKILNIQCSSFVLNPFVHHIIQHLQRFLFTLRLLLRWPWLFDLFLITSIYIHHLLLCVLLWRHVMWCLMCFLHSVLLLLLRMLHLQFIKLHTKSLHLLLHRTIDTFLFNQFTSHLFDRIPVPLHSRYNFLWCIFFFTYQLSPIHRVKISLWRSWSYNRFQYLNSVP